MLPNFHGRLESKKKKKNLVKTQVEDTKIDKCNAYVCSTVPIVRHLPTTIKKINNNKNK